MGNYLYGETPSTIYKELLGIGGTADRAGVSASLKAVWTDDGAGSANPSSFTLSSDALRMETSNQLRFRDNAIYIYSSGDTVMNLVADGEIDLATAAVDINATSTCAIDNTNTSNGVKIGAGVSGMPITLGHTTSETTVADNLTVTGTTAHTSAVTVASGIKVQFVDSNEYVSGNSSDLTIGASSDINLTASADVNIPSNVGLTFGNDGEKIEGDGTDLTITGNNIKLTATADVVIPANVGITFGSGEKIEGDSTNLTLTSGADIALTATSDVNLPNDVGMVFGDDGEKIEGDGTDLTIVSSGVLNLAAGGTTNQIKVTDGAILPITDDDVDLGSASYQFKNAYIDGTLEADAITIGGTAVSAGGATKGFAIAVAIAL